MLSAADSVAAGGSRSKRMIFDIDYDINLLFVASDGTPNRARNARSTFPASDGFLQTSKVRGRMS